MLSPLVTMSIFFHKQLCGCYVVLLLVSGVPLSQAAFWGHTEPRGLWSKEADLDLWKSIDPDLPVNFLPDLDDVLLAAEPPTNHPHTEGSMPESFEQQISSLSSEKFGSLQADRLLISRASSPSSAINNDAPLSDCRQLGHLEGFGEEYTEHLGIDQYHSPRTGIAPQIGVLPIERHQSSFSTRENPEAGKSLHLESSTGMQHRTCDLSPTAHSAWESTELALSPSLTREPISGNMHASPPRSIPPWRCLETVEEAHGGLQGVPTNLHHISGPRSQIYSPPTSFQECQKIIAAAKEAKQQSGRGSPHNPLTPYHEDLPTSVQISKRHKFFYQIKGQTNEAIPSTSQSSHQATGGIDQPEVDFKVSRANEALMQTVADIKDKILDPAEHGYVKSFHSFLGSLENTTNLSESSLAGVFWIKGNDAKRFFLNWDRARVPYPPPFDIEVVRRQHVRKCFKDIVFKEVGHQPLLQVITDVVQTSCEKINHNVSAHGMMPVHMKEILKDNRRAFSDKVVFSCTGALFLGRAIDSIFSRKETTFGTTCEMLDEWRFFKKFWQDFSLFQSDFEQRYSWLKYSLPGSMHINRVLEKIKSNLSRPHDTEEGIHLSWLLTEVWLSERRPTLYKDIRNKQGKIDQRFSTIFYQFLTYIPKLKYSEYKKRTSRKKIKLVSKGNSEV